MLKLLIIGWIIYVFINWFTSRQRGHNRTVGFILSFCWRVRINLLITRMTANRPDALDYFDSIGMWHKNAIGAQHFVENGPKKLAGFALTVCWFGGFSIDGGTIEMALR